MTFHEVPGPKSHQKLSIERRRTRQLTQDRQESTATPGASCTRDRPQQVSLVLR